jgi:hypothetical protein
MAEEILGEDAGEPEVTGNTALTAEEGKDDAGDAGKGDAGKEASEGDADHKADEEPKDGDADKGQDGALDEYAEFTVPEGMTIDKEAVKEFHPLLKDVGASQEQAQAFIDLQVKVSGKLMQDQRDAWAETQGKWKDAGQVDEEFGKGKYEESIGIARRAMREIGGPPLFKALEDTGMGNHPEFIRVFYRIGKAIGEDNIDFGTINQGSVKSLAERMYPTMAK